MSIKSPHIALLTLMVICAGCAGSNSRKVYHDSASLYVETVSAVTTVVETGILDKASARKLEPYRQATNAGLDRMRLEMDKGDTVTFQSSYNSFVAALNAFLRESAASAQRGAIARQQQARALDPISIVTLIVTISDQLFRIAELFNNMQADQPTDVQIMLVDENRRKTNERWEIAVKE